MSGRTSELSPRLRVALDAARALAAFYVVAHHLARAHGWVDGPGVVLRFGQEAVLVFFLLSGFVIFANEHRRATRPRAYYLRRLRRIYPPLLIALAVSALVAAADGTLAARFSTASLVGTLADLQDISALKPGVIVDPFLGNDPLWSLSYEMAFYLVFPGVLALWNAAPRRVDHLVGLICCLCYMLFVAAPSHVTLVAAYFLLWWVGAMTARAYLDGARDVRAIGTPLVWLALLCAIAGLAVVHVGYRGFGYYPFLQLRHFAFGLVLPVLLFGPLGRWLADRLMPLHRAAGWLASVSYGVYVLHYPLLVDWSFARTAISLPVAGTLLLLLSWWVERKLMRMLPRAPSS